MSATVCIIQARMGSTRLAGKVLLPLQEKPVLIHVLNRVLNSTVDQIIVATTTQKHDDRIVHLVQDLSNKKICVYRGSENDVLDRYYKAAKQVDAKTIVRITSDCPLIDPAIINKVLDTFHAQGCDYASNTLTPTYPRGMDVEVMSFKALEQAWTNATTSSDREHVTQYIRRNPNLFVICNVESEANLSKFRLTLDEKDDYTLLCAITDELYAANPFFSLADIIEFLEKNPSLANINNHIEQRKP